MERLSEEGKDSEVGREKNVERERKEICEGKERRGVGSEREGEEERVVGR